MKHSSARIVIERTFGLLKLHWGMIRNGSYYPIDSQIAIILACCYLHNPIRQQMSSDPFEPQLEAFLQLEGNNIGVIDCTESSTEWTEFRDGPATRMWDAWLAKSLR
uniref:DDE Tnp4 domain-containing protein n=1 Tax=Arundo donax TaxID=35708 RepID=A0A0A9GA85_ARUDO